jgi:hypothetical protein
MDSWGGSLSGAFMTNFVLSTYYHAFMTNSFCHVLREETLQTKQNKSIMHVMRNYAKCIPLKEEEKKH